MTSSPKTRVEKMKIRSKTQTSRNKRIITGVGILLIICAAYFIIMDFQQKAPQTDMAAAKAAPQPKKSQTESNSKTKNSTTPTEKKTTESSTVSIPSSDYILPDSDKRLLTLQDIASLTKDQLRLARNEIYARHGYIFKTMDLQNYFSSKPWYHTDPSYKGSLSQTEQKNVNLLKAREDSL